MAKIVTRFPRKVREIENVWIPMPDGTKLAARIWLPEDAERDPVPAVLEFIPYRKRDFTAMGDALHHPYMAGHGYAAVRCDCRGNGDSEGLFDDEYSKQELDDGFHVIAWLAKQPWCTGAVGMMGISWGGFNCLQVAALQPPALKAIYSVCSTDDRYADDVHYMGGCLINENLNWGATMSSFAMRPPDPRIVGGRWREMWHHRLENAPNLVLNWMRHQHRDGFWKHGSVNEDYAAIKAAVYAVGGWADGYSNAIPRLMAGLTAPAKALIGPWSHAYSWKAKPEPSIGGLQDLVRWWDHWLKGRDTGMMAEPRMRIWMQESVPPRTYYGERPGRWIAEDAWPSANVTARRLHLNPGCLDDRAKREQVLTHMSEQVAGTIHGEWCPYGYEAEMPSDQREEDGRSLAFDSAPLSRRTEILGAPVAELDVACDQPLALLYLRLNDVAPDGQSTRVTFGVLNLTHRTSHEFPEPLEPGKRYRVKVQLNDIAHVFPKGHRIRLTVQNNCWPHVLPSPVPVTLNLFTGASTLDLPVRPRQQGDKRLKPFAKPETAAPMATATARPYHRERRLSRDFVTGETLVEVVKDRGEHLLSDIDLTFGGGGRERYWVRDGDPLSARAEVTYRLTLRRDDDYDVRIETTFAVSATQSDFLLTSHAEAFERGVRVWTRSWDETVPRELT